MTARRAPGTLGLERMTSVRLGSLPMHFRVLPVRSSAAAAVLVAACGSAGAQEADALRTRALAATCAQCHGTDGRPADGTLLHTLAGMPREQILARLAEFRAGTRPATVMHQIAKGYSEAQLEQLATYFSTR